MKQSYQEVEAKAVDVIKRAIPNSLKNDMVKQSKGMFAELYESKILPTHYVATASRTTRGSGERAVEETFNRIDGFRAEAVQTVMGLREALWTLDEDDMNPSPDAIKGNLHVRGLLTEYLWAKDSLGKFSWSPRRAKHGPNMRRKDRLDELGKLIEEADDDTRVQLWREALVANRLRLDFWRKQVDLLKTEEASPPTEEELQLGVREARAMLDRFTERVDREGQEPTQSSGTESL